MKKVVFIVLVLVLMLAIAVPAFAAVTETGNTVVCTFPPPGVGQANRFQPITIQADGILNSPSPVLDCNEVQDN